MGLRMDGVRLGMGVILLALGDLPGIPHALILLEAPPCMPHTLAQFTFILK
jgi:hypothetical protein